MKLQKFYILAAAALLFGAFSAQAQTVAFNATAGPFDNLEHDCVVKSETGSQVLLLNHQDIVVQSFTTCTSGKAQVAYVIIKQSDSEGLLQAYITDSRGEVIEGAKTEVRESFSGMLKLKFDGEASLKSNQQYFLKLRALGTNLVIEGRYGDAENTLHLNGWKLDGNISAAVGMRESIDRPAAIVDGRNPYGDDNLIEDRASEFNTYFSVFPNPFSEDFSVKFNRDLKGETILMLTDLSGNVLHREVRNNPLDGTQVYMNPIYNLHPGAYALRIINDHRVYTQTLMKQ